MAKQAGPELGQAQPKLLLWLMKITSLGTISLMLNVNFLLLMTFIQNTFSVCQEVG